MLDKELGLNETYIAEIISPRLTAVITTIDAKGRVNAAPYSFFTPVSYVPFRVCFSAPSRKHVDFPRSAHYHRGEEEPRASEVLKLEQYARETEHTLKDTVVNVLEQGEFGVNMLPIENLEQMEITAGIFPYGVNEIEMAGLTAYPSTKIKPPLIKEAKVGIECVMVTVCCFAPCQFGAPTLIIGEGVATHVDSDIIEGGEIKPERMRSILEFRGPQFGVCTEFHYQEHVRYARAIRMLKAKG